MSSEPSALNLSGIHGAMGVAVDDVALVEVALVLQHGPGGNGPGLSFWK
jgi:hypothetical protein